MHALDMASRLLAIALLAGALHAGEPPQEAASGPDQGVELHGAGAPAFGGVMEALLDRHAHNDRGFGLKLQYEGVGFHKGVRELLDGHTVFVGCDDLAESSDLDERRGGYRYLPVAAWGVGIAYHIDGLKGGLVVDGPTLAGICMGDIKRWSDPRIAVTLQPSATEFVSSF